MPAVVVDAETFALKLIPVVDTVKLLPPFILYVKVYGAVPFAAVKVIDGLVPF